LNSRSTTTAVSPLLLRTGLLIDGMWEETDAELEVRDKFTGELIARLSTAGAAEVERAVGAAAAAMRREEIEPANRAAILRKTAEILARRRREVVRTMVAETGFTTSECVGDFERTLQTLEISAEEAKRIVGEIIPLDGAAGQSGRLGYTLRVPVGVVAAITPFNSPLNTVAHKVAPALAAGNAVVLKPAEQAPLCAVHLCEALVEAGLPRGWINLLHGDGRTGALLVEDPRVAYYTFTGSTEVGRLIQKGAGLRRTQLELGNISATIVCADATLGVAIPRCVATAFRKAGQVCTSLQRLYVERSLFPTFLEKFKTAAAKLTVGDPRDPATAIGPMISEAEAERAERWINEALAGGARLVLGGGRRGALFQPTILVDVTKEMRVMSEEIFSPVVCVIPFDTLDEAIHAVNDTPYGLAAGLFTSDLSKALRVARRIEVGSFHVNQTSSCRQDFMPYGGMKASGFGREGPRYAIRDMTEERLVTFTPV
jgi:succinate-semialdehyde dehydrogenase/glutarate-semialdehyde dehydrogenase